MIENDKPVSEQLKRCSCGKTAEEHPDGLFHCPFCGKNEKLELIESRNTIQVFCGSCGAKGSAVLDNDESAIEAWNFRPTEQAILDKAVERIEETLLQHIDKKIASADGPLALGGNRTALGWWEHFKGLVQQTIQAVRSAGK